MPIILPDSQREASKNRKRENFCVKEENGLVHLPDTEIRNLPPAALEITEKDRGKYRVLSVEKEVKESRASVLTPLSRFWGSPHWAKSGWGLHLNT